VQPSDYDGLSAFLLRRYTTAQVAVLGEVASVVVSAV